MAGSGLIDPALAKGPAMRPGLFVCEDAGLMARHSLNASNGPRFNRIRNRS
jgi:hypothetical protein